MIRKINLEDKDIFMKYMQDFYKTDAVLDEIPVKNISHTFDLIIQGSPYVDGYFYVYEGEVAGYALLSFTYSNEMGGIVMWLEELYIAPDFQRKGIGSDFIHFLEKEYQDKVGLMRLEVVKTNYPARHLYSTEGFTEVEYMQLQKDMNK